jgi:hypothetical protein
VEVLLFVPSTISESFIGFGPAVDEIAFTA